MLEQTMNKAQREREEKCARNGIERIVRNAPQDHVLTNQAERQ